MILKISNSKKNAFQLNFTILLYLILFLKLNKNNTLNHKTIIYKLNILKKIQKLYDLFNITSPYAKEKDINKIIEKNKNFLLTHFSLINKKYNSVIKTNKTKTRGEVAFSTKKLWKQKGTGRARVGSKNSPILKGGGVTFGPSGITKKFKLNKKLIKLLFLSAVLIKLKDLILFEHIVKENFNCLSKNEVLILFHTKKFKNNKDIIKYHNYKNIKIKQINMVNTFDILKYKKILIKKDDLFVLLTRLMR